MVVQEPELERRQRDSTAVLKMCSILIDPTIVMIGVTAAMQSTITEMTLKLRLQLLGNAVTIAGLAREPNLGKIMCVY